MNLLYYCYQLYIDVAAAAVAKQKILWKLCYES